MVRIVKNCKDTKISDLPAKIQVELDAANPTNYQITGPCFDSTDNKYHVIIIMECNAT